MPSQSVACSLEELGWVLLRKDEKLKVEKDDFQTTLFTADFSAKIKSEKGGLLILEQQFG